MDFHDLIYTRQSCRKFDASRPVEEEKLMRILKAAMLAPSACNIQPWHFTCVTNQDVLNALRPGVQWMRSNSFVNDAPCLIIVTESDLSALGKRKELFQRRGFTAFDQGAAVNYLCLAAREEGLDTCILGMLDDCIIRNVLSLPEDTVIRCGIAVGYALQGDMLRSKQRRPMEESVTFIK